jgi:SsrA-binding protein
MSGIKIIVKNARAGYDFFLEEKIEAGIELKGTEVKTLREGKATINEAFVTIDSAGEAWIHNLTIPQYTFGNINNHEETRKRRLLLHKDEIMELNKKMGMKGLTLIPTMLYFKKSRVKCEIALAKGKKIYDKRETLAKKDVERKIRQGQYE